MSVAFTVACTVSPGRSRVSSTDSTVTSAISGSTPHHAHPGAVAEDVDVADRAEPLFRALEAVPSDLPGSALLSTTTCGRITANIRPSGASATTTRAPESVVRLSVLKDTRHRDWSRPVRRCSGSGGGRSPRRGCRSARGAALEDHDPVGERVGIDGVVGDEEADAVERARWRRRSRRTSLRVSRPGRRAARRAAATGDRWRGLGPARPAGPARPTAPSAAGRRVRRCRPDRATRGPSVASPSSSRGRATRRRRSPTD